MLSSFLEIIIIVVFIFQLYNGLLLMHVYPPRRDELEKWDRTTGHVVWGRIICKSKMFLFQLTPESTTCNTFINNSLRFKHQVCTFLVSRFCNKVNYLQVVLGDKNVESDKDQVRHCISVQAYKTQMYMLAQCKLRRLLK